MAPDTYPSTRIAWPTVVALGLVLVALVVVWLTAGEEHRSEILAGIGAVGAVLLSALPAILRRVAVLIPIALLVALPGCGASALRQHATIATVAAGTLAATAPLAAPACDAALASCEGRSQCIDETAERCRLAAAALEGAGAATRAYLDGLEVAVLADEGAVLPALLAALGALARAWGEAAATLAALGVELPALPSLGALLGAS